MFFDPLAAATRSLAPSLGVLVLELHNAGADPQAGDVLAATCKGYTEQVRPDMLAMVRAGARAEDLLFSGRHPSEADKAEIRDLLDERAELFREIERQWLAAVLTGRAELTPAQVETVDRIRSDRNLDVLAAFAGGEAATRTVDAERVPAGARV